MPTIFFLWRLFSFNIERLNALAVTQFMLFFKGVLTEWIDVPGAGIFFSRKMGNVLRKFRGSKKR